jgi:hypothetical protein
LAIINIDDIFFESQDVSLVKIIRHNNFDVIAFELSIGHFKQTISVKQLMSMSSLDYCTQCSDSEVLLTYSAAKIVAIMLAKGVYNPELSLHQNLLLFTTDHDINTLYNDSTSSNLLKKMLDEKELIKHDLSVHPLDFKYSRIEVNTNEIIPMLHCESNDTERCKLTFNDVYYIHSYVKRFISEIDVIIELFKSRKIDDDAFTEYSVHFKLLIDDINFNLRT